MRLGINWAAAITEAVPQTELTETGLVQRWCAGFKLMGHEPYLLGTDAGPNRYTTPEEALQAANEWARKHFPERKQSQ